MRQGWGEASRSLAKHRPSVPIAALCDSLKVCRQLSISRGVFPTHVDPAVAEMASEPEEAGEEGWSSLDMMDAAESCALVQSRLGLLAAGDLAVVVTGTSISVEVVPESMEDWTEE